MHLLKRVALILLLKQGFSFFKTLEDAGKLPKNLIINKQELHERKKVVYILRYLGEISIIESGFVQYPKMKANVFDIYAGNKIDTIFEGYIKNDENFDKNEGFMANLREVKKEDYRNILKICSYTDSNNKHLIKSKIDENKLKQSTDAILCQISLEEMKIKGISQEFNSNFSKLKTISSLLEQRQLQVGTHEEEIKAIREVTIKKYKESDKNASQYSGLQNLNKKETFKQFSERKAQDRIPKIDLFEALQRDIGGLNRIFLLEDVQNKMEDHKRYLEIMKSEQENSHSTDKIVSLDENQYYLYKNIQENQSDNLTKTNLNNIKSQEGPNKKNLARNNLDDLEAVLDSYINDNSKQLDSLEKIKKRLQYFSNNKK